MASGVKAAGFAGLIRVFFLGFGTYRVDWQPIVYALAIATLLVGSLMAVVQTDVKRMLAYSSINHAGFLLVALQSASVRGVQATLFYLASYTFLVGGSFAVITVVSREGDGKTSLDDYVVAAYLYLRITVSMFMADEDEATPLTKEDLPVPVGVKLALGICIAVTLGVGFLPHLLSGPAADATATLVTFTG